jgi:hypothetical protein
MSEKPLAVFDDRSTWKAAFRHGEFCVLIWAQVCGVLAFCGKGTAWVTLSPGLHLTRTQQLCAALVCMWHVGV